MVGSNLQIYNGYFQISRYFVVNKYFHRCKVNWIIVSHGKIMYKVLSMIDEKFYNFLRPILVSLNSIPSFS
jgi:hypothetical protein